MSGIDQTPNSNPVSMSPAQAAAELDAIEASEREPWLGVLGNAPSRSRKHLAGSVLISATVLTAYFWFENRFGLLITTLVVVGAIISIIVAIQPWMRRRDFKVTLPLRPPADIRTGVNQYRYRWSAPIGIGVPLWLPFAFAAAEFSNIFVLAAVNLIGSSLMVALMAWWTTRMSERLAAGWEPGPFTPKEILSAFVAVIVVSLLSGATAATFVHFLQ